MIDRIHRILAKLEQARSEQRHCFGSETHQFRLNPPLPEAEVTAFEAKHGIRLPEDYRQFLIHAGNGGAGPYYGLMPLEQPPLPLPSAREGRGEGLGPPDTSLAQPCPLNVEMTRSETWIEDLGCKDEDECYRGAMVINTHGCNYD